MTSNASVHLHPPRPSPSDITRALVYKGCRADGIPTRISLNVANLFPRRERPSISESSRLGTWKDRRGCTRLVKHDTGLVREKCIGRLLLCVTAQWTTSARVRNHAPSPLGGHTAGLEASYSTNLRPV
jgi:hypothetical protein